MHLIRANLGVPIEAVGLAGTLSHDGPGRDRSILDQLLHKERPQACFGV